MATIIELLKNGREKVFHGWCQNCISMNKDGHSVPSNSKEAAHWSAVGAIYSHPEAYDEFEDRPYEALSILVETIERFNFSRNHISTFLSEWNDLKTTTQSEVIEAFDKAIYLCKERDYAAIH